MKGFFRFLPLILVSLSSWSVAAQDWVHTGTNLSNQVVRVAAADFKPVGGDPQTTAQKAVFDATLFGDLNSAGIFDMVSKSMAPQAMPGTPQEIVLSQWSAAPANAKFPAPESPKPIPGLVTAWKLSPAVRSSDLAPERYLDGQTVVGISCLPAYRLATP